MVYLVHSKELDKIPGGLPVDWTGLSLSVQVEENRTFLDAGKKFSIAEEIQAVASQVRQNFIDYVGQLSNQQTNKVVWYSSRMASKSVSQTDIFHQYVYVKLLERLAARGKDVIVVTDNGVLMDYVSERMPNNIKIFAHRRTRRPMAKRWKRLKYLGLWMVSRFYKKSVSGYDCLLHTWIDSRLFKGGAEKADPYWGDLESRLKGKGLRVARLAPLSVAWTQVGKIVRHVPNVIFPLAQVDFGILWRCLFLRFDIQVDEKKLAGIEDASLLTFLTAKEILKENATGSYIPYLLYNYAYKAVGAYLPDSTVIIYPYENQPWEKMLNLALPGHRRVGYQHSTIPVNWLDYYASKFEVSEPKPNVVLTSGKRWTEFLQESNKGLSLREVGTIRYQYLFDHSGLAERPRELTDILVVLPIDPVMAVQLQNQIIRLLKDDTLKKYRFLIKPHPHLADRFLRQRALDKFDNVEITGRSVRETLPECALCISVDSTVAFEAVFLGIKTINYIPEDLTLGIEYFIKDCSYCATEANFSDVFKEAVNSADVPRADVSEFFQPVNYDAFCECADTRPDRAKVGVK